MDNALSLVLSTKWGNRQADKNKRWKEKGKRKGVERGREGKGRGEGRRKESTGYRVLISNTLRLLLSV